VEYARVSFICAAVKHSGKYKAVLKLISPNNMLRVYE
jgi:hypothetical protein